MAYPPTTSPAATSSEASSASLSTSGSSNNNNTQRRRRSSEAASIPISTPTVSPANVARSPHALRQQQARTPSAVLSGSSSHLSSSIGAPYGYNVVSTSRVGSATIPTSGLSNRNSSSSSSANSARLVGTSGVATTIPVTVPLPHSVSPRSTTSISGGFLTAESTTSLRRHSDHMLPARKPSTEEVFDLMEREQDAIVLKLMREISQLKDDNRILRQTINQLTSPTHSRSHSRSGHSSTRSSTASLNDIDGPLHTFTLPNFSPNNFTIQPTRRQSAIESRPRNLNFNSESEERRNHFDSLNSSDSSSLQINGDTSKLNSLNP